MGGVNKLLLPFGGLPIVRRVVQAVVGSRCSRVVTVVGHEAESIQETLSGLPIEFVVTREFREGIAASVRAGASAVDPKTDAIVFCLGDMPYVSPDVIDRLIDSFDPSLGLAAWQATFQGRHGNPVLWSAKYLEELRTLHGDEGARSLLRKHANLVAAVEMDSLDVLTDIDAPEDLIGLE